MSTVIIVDDEEHIREDLGKYLRKRNYEVHIASTVTEAKKCISSEASNYVIIDLKLDIADFSGIEVFNYVQKRKPNIKPIILSSYPIEDVKDQLKKKLKDEAEPSSLLKKIEKNYIYKGSAQNYILTVLDKLKEIEQREEKSHSKKFGSSAEEDTNE
ncbi:MAG TPA: response regulator [Candidatus Kapabacteria bacterium]|nr:response regulator [Candidatus Kapabacteria bacterium]